MAKRYLPHVVRGLPPSYVLSGRKLKPKFEDYRKKGVIRVFVGPEEAAVVINLKRPYVQPEQQDGEYYDV